MSDSTDDYTISGMDANVRSFGIIIPLSISMVLAYSLVWGWEQTGTDIPYLFSNYKLLLVSLVAGTIIHELIHALAWMMTSGISWNAMSFGFNWKAIAPYAHCSKPMRVQAYRIGAVAPGLILGILPFLVGFILGQSFLTSFGFLFTLVAGGDFLMLWLIRNVDKDKLVQDHPDKVGCIVTDNIET